MDGGIEPLAPRRVDVGLKWEVDLWGRIRRSIEAARAQLLSRAENQRAVIIGLVSNVAESYFDLRGLDYEVEITNALSSRGRNPSGCPSFGLNRERSRSSTSIGSRQNGQEPRHSWQIWSDKSSKLKIGSASCWDTDRRRLREGFTSPSKSIPPEVPPGLPSDLLQRRPDILKVEQDLAAANATIGVAQAERFPQLALTGAVGGAGLQFQGTSFGPYAVFKGAASVTGPIFNASALGYQVKATEAQTQAAVAQYRKTVLTAFQEVEDALIAVQKTGEQRKALEQQVVALNLPITSPMLATKEDGPVTSMS